MSRKQFEAVMVYLVVGLVIVNVVKFLGLTEEVLQGATTLLKATAVVALIVATLWLLQFNEVQEAVYKALPGGIEIVCFLIFWGGVLVVTHRALTPLLVLVTR